MFHDSKVGPVTRKDESGVHVPIPGKSFHIKGVIEARTATELLTEVEAAALVLQDSNFTRTAGGGMAYDIEVVVDQRVIDAILDDQKKKAEADAEANKAEASVSDQEAHDRALEEAKKIGFKEGQLEAVKEQAKEEGKKSVLEPPSNAS